MNIKNNAIKVSKTTLYSQVNGKVIFMPNWQRTYDWLPETAHNMIREIINCASTPAALRMNNVSYLGAATVYHDKENDRFVVADGHSRMISFGLIFRALRDLCSKRKFNLSVPEPFGVCYELDIANTEYTGFLSNPTGGSKYAKVYMYAYESLDKYISNQNRAQSVLDVMVNYVEMAFEECDSIELAHKCFVQLNTGGENLTKVEVISSFLQFYMNLYSVELDYEYKKLDALLEGYYYWKSCSNIAPSFSVGVITNFMENEVINSRQNLMQFGEYLDNINRYKDTNWFKIAKLLGNKTLAVTYVLAGRGYDMSGKDDKVNRLMTSLIVFDIACFARDANMGGAVSNYFCEIRKQIGCGMDLDLVDAAFRTWASNNNFRYGDTFVDFAKSLDNIKTNYQKAILWYAYMTVNSNSLPTDIEMDHCYPEEHNVVWDKNGWPKTANAQRRLVNSLGNKVLLDKTTNKQVGNAYIVDKNVFYDLFFEKNVAYKYSLNYFDCKRFMAEMQSYLDERRNAYAKLLAETPMGKALIED